MRGTIAVVSMIVGAAVGCASPPDAGGSVTADTAATVRPNKTKYGATDTITIAFAGFPGSAKDWIAIAPPNSAYSTYAAWGYTDGSTSGTAEFSDVGAGTFVARAFADDTYQLIAQSKQFTVSGAPASTADVSTDALAYNAGDIVTVSWTGLTASTADWISIAPFGSSDSVYTTFTYTGGVAAGTTSFTIDDTGTFVARAFLDDSSTAVAESTPFAVN